MTEIAKKTHSAVTKCFLEREQTQFAFEPWDRPNSLQNSFASQLSVLFELSLLLLQVQRKQALLTPILVRRGLFKV